MKEDYPRNLVELEARFSTEEACREYLLKLRWPEVTVLRGKRQSASKLLPGVSAKALAVGDQRTVGVCYPVHVKWGI